MLNKIWRFMVMMSIPTSLQMKQRIAQEYEAFTLTLNDWAKLKEQELQAKSGNG